MAVAVDGTGCYLNTGWAGPSPERVLTRMSDTATTLAQAGPAAPDGMRMAREIGDEARSAVGKLLHMPAGDVVLTHGTTEGINIVLGGLEWKPGDEVLTTTLEHQGLTAPLALLEQRKQVVVRPVVLSSQVSSKMIVDVLKEAITPNTRLVAISHVAFTTGLRLPIQEIVKHAHSEGALVLLDGAQGPGHVDADQWDVDPDFYTVSGQKWLLGPAGTGALYVRHDRQHLLTPLFTGPSLDSRSGLNMHTLASNSPVLLAGFAEALHVHEELGPLKVAAHCLELGAALRERLGAIAGVTVTGAIDPETSSGLTSITLEGWEPDALVQRLWEDHRIAARSVANPPAVRFSTAAFNDESDIERAVTAVEILAR
ncbi:MAG: aminotransferase class V-fold PLP-dependent enzyme [Dehalococcoidia bacterium]